jgi:glycosyltransferase involved in cell wall biosynthesis
MKKRRFRKIERYADRIFVVNPDLKNSLSDAEFIPYASINLDEWTPIQNDRSLGLKKILHSPTSRDIKGTKYVIEACNILKKRGYPVELILSENATHNKMKELHSEADIFIDQLLVGWYGAAAVEAMALGKPVICYLRESDIQDLPFRESIPILNATPLTLVDVLETLLDHPGTMEMLSKRSRNYAETIHDPLIIARRLQKIYGE